jgi:hypothetical protein
MNEMIRFLSNAPYYMLAAFFLAFVLTKLAQSKALYELLREIFADNRKQKVKKIVKEMEAVSKVLLGDEKEENLPPEKRKALERIRQGYYAELGNLYKKGNKDGRTNW